MSGYVVDASVAVKWLVTENFSERAVRLLDQELTLNRA
jgi:predicted nucleic acid-binding protein